jgi:hypothetical protein
VVFVYKGQRSCRLCEGDVTMRWHMWIVEKDKRLRGCPMADGEAGRQRLSLDALSIELANVRDVRNVNGQVTPHSARPKAGG